MSAARQVIDTHVHVWPLDEAPGHRPAPSAKIRPPQAAAPVEWLVEDMAEYNIAHCVLGQGKVFGAHFRNPKGTVPNGYYQEDFLDEGDLDMLAVVRLMRRHGYTGGLDPNHAQGIEGDEGAREAWAWQLGYIRALVRAVRAEAHH